MTGLDNDTRGWIMAAVSGVACIFGACIICVDILVRFCKIKSDFEIRNSDAFLSSSLSLSFGVILFSALYNILPEGKTSLIAGGLSPSAASWTLIACFLGGAVGIQVLSRIFHHYMPSHVVGCEHTHDDEEEGRTHDHSHHSGHNHERRAVRHEHSHHDTHANKLTLREEANTPTLKSSETEPLLRASRRPKALTSRVSSFLIGAATKCDARGPCYGYSDVCGKECLKNKMRRSSVPETTSWTNVSTGQHTPVSFDHDEHAHHSAAYEHQCGISGHSHHHGEHGSDEVSDASTATSSHMVHKGRVERSSHGHGNPSRHHHHVPSNAFLSIGVQTSFAIALHKLPEGFITYATNHANPELGFSIFIALFIHNITEGFALALPLFLAMQSRWKSILLASLLGGASQPLGAGIAALLFHAAGHKEALTSDTVYGCMFAITSGTLTSVALQLFSESLGLTHSKTSCMIWAFVGMGILGMSSALTA